jgi:hypothetical protein
LPDPSTVTVPAAASVAGSTTATPPFPAPSTSAAAASGPPHFAEALDVSTFQRGNLHTHTSRSDGDRPPEDSYRWYRDHGYAFVAVTDHNQLTPPEAYRAIERPGFVIVHGEEITMAVQGHPVHVNALCTKRVIGDVPDHALEKFATRAEALRWAVAKVHEQDAVAMVNHPNFIWALTADDVASAHGAQLLEMWSGHPFVHSAGDEHHPSEEAIWDDVLSRGENFAGVAVDDTHYIGPHRDPAARPGRGWVEVFANEASEPAICEALSKGRLYASSGARLRRIAVTADTLSVWPTQPDATVAFIGAGGKVLARIRPAAGEAASYHVHGGERYVRARVELPNGKRAFTQAYRVTSEGTP